MTQEATIGTPLRHHLATSWAGRGYDGLDDVVHAVSWASKDMHHLIQQAALGDVLGKTGEINVQGEQVERLDKMATEAFVRELGSSGQVAAVVAEELDDMTIINDSPEAQYISTFDPIDGSSNIDVAVSIGSIFAFYRRDTGEPITEASFLRPGREQIAAAYVVYGSSTVMIVATREGVDGFTLNVPAGEFRLSHPGIRIPAECPYYSANEGNFNKLEPAMQQVFGELRSKHSLRYVGSLVADFHRNLLKGGVFLYPGDTKSAEGKLRLLYEANPLSFVAAQAGGDATTGTQRILDVQPGKLHQRIPLIVGNADVVRSIHERLAEPAGLPGAIKSYLAAMQKLPEVRKIVAVEDPAVTTLWTIIDAPRSDRGEQRPIYEAQAEAFRLVDEPQLDFRVINLNSLLDRSTAEVVPSDAKQLWSRDADA